MINIIIPVHNEEKLIEKTLTILENKLFREYRIIVVDDFSTDRTRDIVGKIAVYNKNIELISNAFKTGIAGALKTGFERADRDSVVVPVMGDLCDQPETIEQMYNKIQEGYDIVCASRYTKGGRRIGGPILKGLASRYLSRFIYLLYKFHCSDPTNSFKMYRKNVLDNIDIESRGFEVSLELILKAKLLGYKITEVSTTWKDRETGESKFRNFRDGWRYFKWLIFIVKGCS